jgi:hypothetical protein
MVQYEEYGPLGFEPMSSCGSSPMFRSNVVIHLQGRRLSQATSKMQVKSRGSACWLILSSNVI